MTAFLSVALIVGGLTCVVFRVPLARAQARAQKKFGLAPPEIYTPALLVVFGLVAMFIGAALALTALRGQPF